eukprot:jgi/Botrbrau1/17835/Bobra.0127s0078.1
MVSTLKALELLTNCYILVQGTTVAAMGPFQGLKSVRRIVEDCIKNVHPIYHIKTLMIKRELAKDPAMRGENWDRYLPKFKKKNVKRKKPMLKSQEKKPYTPFPPPQRPRKVDLLMATGEYFEDQKTKRLRANAANLEQKSQKEADKQRRREAVFEPPEESPAAPSTIASTTEDMKMVATRIQIKTANSGPQSVNNLAAAADTYLQRSSRQKVKESSSVFQEGRPRKKAKRDKAGG